MKTNLKTTGKAMLVTFVLLVTLTLTSFAASFNFESYTIKAVEVANSQMAKSWDLQYTESGNKLTITLTEKNGEKEYLVRGKFLEVCYVMNKKGFGARPVRSSQSEVPAQIVNNVINFDNLAKQRVLSPEQLDNEGVLNMIAGFLPELLNENYKHIL